MELKIVFRRVILVIVILASVMVAQTVWSASPQYPTKPIVLIVPFSAGGSSDLGGRILAEYVKKYLGAMIVVNRPGGSCTIAGNEVVESPKDGYTLEYVSGSALWQPIYDQTKYDYSEALEAIGNLTEGRYSIIVRGDSPWKSLQDLVVYAKQHPEEIKFGHSGYGNSTHLTGEIFALKAGIKMNQVPFKGVSEAVPALLGGHIQAVTDSPVSFGGFIQSGELRVLAVTGNGRYHFLPDVPTFTESGYPVDVVTFEGVGAPKGIPADVKAKLADTFKKVASDGEYVKRMDDQLSVVKYYGPDELQKIWQSYVKNSRALVKQLGIYDKIRQANK